MSESFYLFLNSKDVNFGTSANFQVDFQQSGIKFSDGEIAIGLDYVVFPNLIYPIRSGKSNKLTFNEGGSDLVATIDEGYYDSSSFPIALKTALDNAGANTYTVSISSTTNKITISATGNFSMKFGTTTQTSPYMWKILGFNYDSTTSSAASHTGTMPIRLDGEEYYCLNIENLPSSNISSSFSQRGIMGIIPLKSAYGDIIFHQFNEKNNLVLASMNDIKFLRVRITDPDGVDIPLPDNGEVMISLRIISTQVKYNGQT